MKTSKVVGLFLSEVKDLNVANCICMGWGGKFENYEKVLHNSWLLPQKMSCEIASLKIIKKTVVGNVEASAEFYKPHNCTYYV